MKPHRSNVIAYYFNKVHFTLWSMKMFFIVNYYYRKYNNYLQKTLQFSHKYEGKRCFIIGNGPSLSKDDLDTLYINDEITFASNRVYKMYPITNWRPSFYSVCDKDLYIDNSGIIDNLDNTIKFIPLDLISSVNNKEQYYYYLRYPFKLLKKYPKFSSDFSKKFGEGNTVTYHLLQIAVCMGFKEIYLLGCDFSYNIGIDEAGNIVRNDNQKNYPWNEESVLYNVPNLQSNLYAYTAARNYCDNNDIKIYNATRGGKLEVFRRVNFDSLFDTEGKK